jgi:hypothetical protein
MKKTTYTHDAYQVYAGKMVIARAYTGDFTAVRILQGMNRRQTMIKICQDCPEFAKEYDLSPEYYPYLFTK